MKKQINSEWLETYGWYIDKQSGKWTNYELGVAQSIEEAAEMTDIVVSMRFRPLKIGSGPNLHVKS